MLTNKIILYHILYKSYYRLSIRAGWHMVFEDSELAVLRWIHSYFTSTPTARMEGRACKPAGTNHTEERYFYLRKGEKKKTMVSLAFKHNNFFPAKLGPTYKPVYSGWIVRFPAFLLEIAWYNGLSNSWFQCCLWIESLFQSLLGLNIQAFNIFFCHYRSYSG